MAGDTAGIVVPLRPSGLDCPTWLRYLLDAAATAALRPVSPPRRLLLALPTSELAAATVAVGAVSALVRLRKTAPLTAPSADQVGKRVSVFHSGCYCDSELRACDDASARLRANVILTRNLDVIRPLPEDFPEDRSDRRLKSESETVQVWQEAAGVGPESTRIHARVSATPVVVIGHRNVIDAHLAELGRLWPGAARLVDAGRGLDAWFRHPAIVCSPQCDIPPWLREIQPSLVICDGAAAWNSRLRLEFPDAPHVLVLDRRSQAAVALVEDIKAGNPRTEPFAPVPPAGIEGWRIGELRVALPIDDDEDLF